MIARALTTAIVALGAVVPVAQQAPQLVRTAASRRKQATSIDREIAAVGTQRRTRVDRLARADGRRRAQHVLDAVLGRVWLRARTAARADRRVCAAADRARPRSGRARGRHRSRRAGARRRRQARAAATVSDDCPIDAGGRPVTGSPASRPPRACASSRAWCGATTCRSTSAPVQRLGGVGHRLHRDPAADAILDRLATPTRQRHAAPGRHIARSVSRRARLRDAQDAHRDRERSRAPRVSFVTALGQTRQPGTADALLALAQNDADPKVRAEAVYWYPVRAGAAGITRRATIIDKDADDNVKKRAVSGLAGYRTTAAPAAHRARSAETNPVVRKEAVSALGQSKDPRAVAFLERYFKR